MAHGAEWWRAQASGQIVGLANDGTRVYATSADGNVYAWEMGSGASVWVLNTGSELGAAPLTDSGSVLVGTLTGEVRYIEATTGQELTDLKLTLNDSIYYTPAPSPGMALCPGRQRVRDWPMNNSAWLTGPRPDGQPG